MPYYHTLVKHPPLTYPIKYTTLTIHHFNKTHTHTLSTYNSASPAALLASATSKITREAAVSRGVKALSGSERDAVIGQYAPDVRAVRRLSVFRLSSLHSFSALFQYTLSRHPINTAY